MKKILALSLKVLFLWGLLLCLSSRAENAVFIQSAGGLADCEQTVKTCEEAVTNAIDEIGICKKALTEARGQRDQAEALLQTADKTSMNPLSYVGVAGIGAVVAGPVGAVVGTGVLALVNLVLGGL